MQFDIIIVGGGMVGAAMGCALRTSPYQVAMIDASPLHATADHRLIALGFRSVCLFKNLGIWPELENIATPIQQIHVSHRNHFGITRVKADEVGLNDLGHVVPAHYITPALYNKLGNVTLIRPATLKALSQTDESATLTVETPQGLKTLTAKVIIGADGTQSTVRQLLAIPTKTVDYQQSALVTTTKLQRPHQHIAYERFQPKGAIAMLPLQDDEVATIWTDTNDAIQHLLGLSENEFLATLQHQFGYRLGKLKKIGQRYTYPLRMVQAEKQIDQRVILMGNAAHTFHPIAAQGLNLALYEIAVLTEFFANESLESFTLKNVALPQQKLSLQLSHQLSTFFSYDFFMLNTLRKIGLLSLDLFPALKQQFASQVITHSKSIPPLMLD